MMCDNIGVSDSCDLVFNKRVTVWLNAKASFFIVISGWVFMSSLVIT